MHLVSTLLKEKQKQLSERARFSLSGAHACALEWLALRWLCRCLSSRSGQHLWSDLVVNGQPYPSFLEKKGKEYHQKTKDFSSLPNPQNRRKRREKRPKKARKSSQGEKNKEIQKNKERKDREGVNQADRPRKFTRISVPARSANYLLIFCSFSVIFMISWYFLVKVCRLSVNHLLIAGMSQKWSVNGLLTAKKRFTLNSLSPRMGHLRLTSAKCFGIFCRGERRKIGQKRQLWR